MSEIHLLVVDDDRGNCALVSSMLEKEGYQVDVANDGVHALEMVESRPYTLALLDYQMPGMDGVELYRRIRELRPDTLGVFLTAHTTLDTVYPAISAGAERVLAKPVNREELIPLIERMAGRPGIANS
ncbi:MAG: response regulator [Planctomycetia bacterium]|nr:response regulator [Planctomycetia bacterium]